MAIIRGFRCLALIAIIAGLVGSAAITRQAVAQETFSAAVLEGSCDAPGDVAAELRDLHVAEGGALTSFTTIDVAIKDLTTDEFVVVVGDPAEPIACGEIIGEGTDIYVALPAQGDSTSGGIAWLHARDERTQVSIFLGEGLGGSTDGNSETDGDGPPEPPIDETPEPAGNEITYTSPNYGYTVTYDSDFWAVAADETVPDSSGPLDHLLLASRDRGEDVYADFIGLPGVTVDAVQYLKNYLAVVQDEPTISSAAIHLDADGNEVRGGDSQHAFMAIDIEGETESGKTVLHTFYLEVWVLESSQDLLLMNFETTQDEYDRWIPLREQLEANITLPE
jgi:hypothetical protein